MQSPDFGRKNPADAPDALSTIHCATHVSATRLGLGLMPRLFLHFGSLLCAGFRAGHLLSRREIIRMGASIGTDKRASIQRSTGDWMDFD